MTAEIAILNKNGVALAADSAVTLARPDTQKIYNTANKLFMLSKYHPVGIMVHGTAELMGIPWETIIKIYREGLHTRDFEKLVDFASDFLNFLGSNRTLFPEDVQKARWLAMCSWTLSGIQTEINESVKAEVTAQGQIDDAKVSRIIGRIVGQKLGEWNGYPVLDCFPQGFEEELKLKCSADLDELIDRVFAKLPIAAVREDLRQICLLCLAKDFWSDSSGGVVVAGFGKGDILPVVQSYTVQSIVNNQLKFQHMPAQSNDMNESRAASIIPFAQGEMVDRFIRGLDPEYRTELKNFIRQLLMTEYPEKLLQLFEARLSEDEKRGTRAELIRLARTVLSEFDSTWSDWERTKFVNPVLDVVGDLPKDELAAMAESLVNLTSFKRRITAEAETVGGPIDVAVISKGDGFVWIKRKHYFEKDLNPAFFANYYRRYE